MTEQQLPDKPQTRAKKSEDYRNLILTVSNELFQKYGVEHVTMRQIAKEANIGQASLYRRYSNLGEICMEILSSDTQDFLKELNSFLVSSHNNLKPLEQLNIIIEKIADYIDGKATMLIIIKNEYSRDLQLLQFNHPVFLYLIDIISDLYSKAMSSGEIIEINVTLTTQTLIAALSPDLIVYQQKVLGFSKIDIVDGIRKIYIDGLGRVSKQT